MSKVQFRTAGIANMSCTCDECTERARHLSVEAISRMVHLPPTAQRAAAQAAADRAADAVRQHVEQANDSGDLQRFAPPNPYLPALRAAEATPDAVARQWEADAKRPYAPPDGWSLALAAIRSKEAGR